MRNEDYQHTVTNRGIEHARPSEAWNHFSSTPVDVIAHRFGFEGPALVHRRRLLVEHDRDRPGGGRDPRGRADAALAGGTDALARLTFSGFNALRLMDPEPCRPFDRGRAGMNIGEGAAILVLEELERARRARRAHLWRAGRLQLRVRGVSSDGAGAGGAAGRGGHAARRCGDAARDADEVDHVNAHGTATPQNDRAEATRLPRACSATAPRAMPVTSLKSMIGHCLGAAGAVEAARWR